jgi:hypothetical protein
MRTNANSTVAVALVAALAASSAWAGTVDGTVKVGGVIFSQTGDRSTVQETYNIHDGFSLTQIQLHGLLTPRNYFSMDLRDINFDSRQGDFLYRIPDRFKLTAAYDQHQQVFDPARSVNSLRKDLRIGAEAIPSRWLYFSGFFNYLTRDGDRLAFPAGTVSALGTGYDNRLATGQLTAEVHQGRYGGAVSYGISKYSDDLNAAAERTGDVVSGRLWAPTPFYDRWTNFFRAAYGERRLSTSGLEYKMADFQYTGIVQPVERFQLKYAFAVDRVDDKSTALKTDRFQNDVDATWYHRYGSLTGGYGYETNDDDHRLTSYQSWRGGALLHYRRYVTAKVDYAGRNKKDEEHVTLLQDIESSRWRASLDLQPTSRLSVGGWYSRRERELTDIGVKVDGDVASASGRYDREGWGSLATDYTYSLDKYTDLTGRFEALSHIVTARADVSRIRNLTLAGGLTYLDIRRDLKIEKWVVFAEGSFRLLRDYHVELKYNAYNYDDYVLITRYYTANVWRINLAYDLHL